MRSTLAATTSDEEGFREIQLSGKQMFFLFMAATTVLVVAFMLGMLVGRGVRAEREEVASVDTLSPTAAAERAVQSTPDDADPRKAAPPAPAENDADAKTAKAGESTEEPPVAVKRNQQDSAKGTDAKTSKVPEPAAPKAADAAKPVAPATKPSEAAAKQLADAKVAAKTPETRPAPVAPKPEAVKPPVPAPSPAPAAAAAPASSSERNGFAVQVAAVNARGEADAIAKRLSGKGYPAYVEVPKGSASTFRVRVGTFETRHEAQDIADKLKKDEKFKPWVTR
jgi:hypothetical protein